MNARRGSITITTALTMSGLIVVSALIAHMCTQRILAHRAAAAADLSALAAASLRQYYPLDQACRQAAEIAQANGVHQQHCQAAGSGVLITVMVGGHTSQARAEPMQDPTD